MPEPAGEKVGEEVEEVKVPRLLAVSAALSWRVLVTAAAVTLAVVVLIRLYVVVVPVVLALFLAAVLEPLVARLRRHRWPAPLAAAAVFLGALAVLVALLFWIGSNVARQFEDVGDQVNQAVEDVKEWATGDPLNLTPERVNEIEQQIRDAARKAGGGAAQQAAGQARAAGEVLGGLVLLLFTLFFVLKDGERMAAWMKEQISAPYREDVSDLVRDARRIMRQYMIATAATGFIDGVLIGIALWILGVPLVLPLAVLTFIGGFIPIVGATVAGLIAALVALVTNGFATALLVVAATVAVQQIEGNLLQPLILERAVRLHPLVTVWAVGAGIIIGGLLGAFLSVPIIAIAVAAGSHYRRKRGLGPEPAAELPPEPEPDEPTPAPS
ncbi:MAG: AI-2E family transporter [Acidimicrobiales bacterium]